MKEIVISQFLKMQFNFKKILQNNESMFSFSIDGWTARNNCSYYGITIHFIDAKWKYHSLALDLVPSNGNHTGKDIANLFYEVVKNYAIQNKIQGMLLFITVY